jgi:hypothetical protein
MQLKKAASPGSLSVEESEGNTGSLNKLKLRTTSSFDLPRPLPHTTILNSQASSVTGPNRQALLSAMFITPSLPLMIQKAKRQLSIHPGNSDEAAAYHCFLQGIGGQTGPNLSLSPLSGVGCGSLRSASGPNFAGGNQCVPWLRASGAQGEVTTSHGRSMNLGHLKPDKSSRGAHHSVGSCTGVMGQMFPTPMQNLLPQRQSRDMVGPEWISGNQESSPQYLSASLGNLSEVQLGEHQTFTLFESHAESRGDLACEPGPVGECHHQDGVEGFESTPAGGDGPKLHQQEALKPETCGSSIYGSRHDIV